MTLFSRLFPEFAFESFESPMKRRNPQKDWDDAQEGKETPEGTFMRNLHPFGKEDPDPKGTYELSQTTPEPDDLQHSQSHAHSIVDIAPKSKSSSNSASKVLPRPGVEASADRLEVQALQGKEKEKEDQEKEEDARKIARRMDLTRREMAGEKIGRGERRELLHSLSGDLTLPRNLK